jgi:RimJ/RimL family protein N-acetyltransferase
VSRVGVRLRELEDADLDRLFWWEQDPGAIAMAAFTRADPADREAFDRHYDRIRANPETMVLAIEADRDFAGTIGSYPMGGDREVTYWIDPARWGRGIASQALEAYLGIEVTRPLRARVAAHNIGSATVLERAGFVHTGAETGYAPGLGRDVVEHVYQLTS